ALIWLHMGRNAARVPDFERLPDLPPFLRNLPDRPKPLKPSADKCFQDCIKLAPDLLEAHLALLEYHRERDELAKAERAARQLLAHYPDHGPTQETLADLLMEEGRHEEALAFFQRALKGRPLDRKLRGKLGTAHTYFARACAEAGQFEQARAEYRTTLEF